MRSVKCAEEISLPLGETVSVKCALHSRLAGLTVTALLESETEGFITIKPAVREVLSAFSKFHVPITNQTDDIVTVTKGAIVRKATFLKVLFHLEQDSLELQCNSICVEDFTEVESHMNSIGGVGLLDPDDEEEVLPHMKLLWGHMRSLGHLKDEQRMELVKVLWTTRHFPSQNTT